MTTLPGIRAEFAQAVRAVNAARLRLPAGCRPALADFDQVAAEVEAACAAGDQGRALAAIDAWRDKWLRLFDWEQE